MPVPGRASTAVAALPPLPAPIQYELRIGVTGHRDLANPEAVEQAVRRLLQQLVVVLESASAAPLGPHGTPQTAANRIDRLLTQALAVGTRILCPVLDGTTRLGALLLRPWRWREVSRTSYWPRVPPVIGAPAPDRQTPLKLTVISALASGADQIVARAVCELVRRPELRNRYLEAVLPFPIDVYEQDFTNPGHLESFRDLLALDRGRWNTHPEPTVLCPDFPACLDPDDPAVPLSREKAYAAAGRYVVETSEIVVAIWDPAREDKPGGTGETVRYALDRGRVVLWINPAHLPAEACVLRSSAYVATPDDATKVPPSSGHGEPRALRIDPLPARAKQLSRNFHRLAAYNRDPAVDERPLRRALDEEETALRGLAARAALPYAVTETLAGALLPHVVRADHLSTRYRQLREAAARVWPTAAALVVTVMAFQIIFLPDLYWLAFVELGVLLLGYVSYRVSLYGGWHEKWLNDRHLADGLRAALFTALVLSDDDPASEQRQASSVRPGFGRVQDPLPFYDPANAWFVGIVKRILRRERRQFAQALNFDHPPHRAAVRTCIRDGWIGRASESHRASAVERRAALQRAGRIRLAMILALMAVALLHGLGIGHHGSHTAASFARVDLWIALATVALPAWTAAFHVMLTLEDGEQGADRSEQMAALLRGLADRLDTADGLSQFRECVAEAERIMDVESREWAESLADRKPEFTG